MVQGLALVDDYDHEQLDRKGRTIRPAIYPGLTGYAAVVDAMKAAFLNYKIYNPNPSARPFTGPLNGNLCEIAPVLRSTV